MQTLEFRCKIIFVGGDTSSRFVWHVHISIYTGFLNVQEPIVIVHVWVRSSLLLSEELFVNTELKKK